MASSDSPGTVGRGDGGDSAFHVVCRECRYETVEETRTAAEDDVAAHTDEADHRVTYDRIE